MILREEREQVVAYGKKMVQCGLAQGTFGNISIYNSELNLMAISPSGMDYFETSADDVVVLKLDGQVVEGQRKPSSEYLMHCIFYEKRRDINAIVHTHSKFATTLACLNWSIQPIHYLVGYAGKDIPCTKYIKFGTSELGEEALKVMGDRYACLLGNHGLLACGFDIAYAFDVAQQMEFVAEIYYRSKIAGEPLLLDDKEILDVLDVFENYTKRGKS